MLMIENFWFRDRHIIFVVRGDNYIAYTGIDGSILYSIAPVLEYKDKVSYLLPEELS